MMERLELLESQLIEAFDSAVSLRCYTYSTYGYSVHIICASFPEGDLEKNWRPLNNAIALTIQAQIRKPVERYNIYLLMFEADILVELRTVIENDRYCCRKIIVRESMPENNAALEAVVENRLFRFSDPVLSEKVQPIQNLIDSADPSGRLFQLIASLKLRVSIDEAQRAIDIL